MAKKAEYSRFGEGTEWTFSGKKVGGVNDAGVLGGVHTKIVSGQPQKMALIKSDKHFEKNISEFLGSRIFGATNPGYGAQVFFTVPNGVDTGLPNDGSGVYVRSEFFGRIDPADGKNKGYKDMYVDMDQYMSDATRPSNLVRKEGRPVLMGARNKLNGTLDKAFTELGYTGFEQVGPASLLIGDFDMHTGNIGVVRDESEKNPRLVRIDFGGAFYNLTADKAEIHPHSRMRHPGTVGKIATLGLGGGKPTNHFREFPRKLKLTHEFADAALNAANQDLSKTIDESFAEMEKYYTPEAITKWAQRSMPALFNDEQIVPVQSVKDSFKDVMQTRQNSLREFALEIKLGLLLTKQQDKKYVVDKDALKKLVQEYPDYFKAIADGTKKVRLRDKKIRGSYFTGKDAEKLIKKEVKQLIMVDRVLGEVAGVSASNQAQTPPSLPKGKARDVSVVLESPSGTIEAVRNHVIDKQNKLLQANIALGTKDPVVSELISSLSREEFLSYIRAPENQASIEEALKNPLVKGDEQKALYEAEAQGYKAIQDSFKEKATPLKWADSGAEGKSQDQKVQIVEHNGVELCKLTQKAADIQTGGASITLENGSVKSISKCRFVDFPLHIADNTGPVHISLAVQDENGRNIPKRKAVYFTADYDKSGKLVEVSCPVGVKFNSKSDNAVGYIERDGVIYTIPVNQGTYKQMMAEVAKNRSQTVNIEQEIEEERAVDSFVRVSEVSANIDRGLDQSRQERADSVSSVMSSSSVADRSQEMMGVVNANKDQRIIDPSASKVNLRQEGAVNSAGNIAPNVAVDNNANQGVSESGKKLYMDPSGFSEAEQVGGLRRSKKVTREVNNQKITYQLKSSILDATTSRRLLAGGKDHQNFGEVIAAKIGAAIMNQQGQTQLVPTLSLVYDNDKKRCLVASEYLPNVDRGTLDDYAIKSAGVKKRKTFASNIRYNVAKVFGMEATDIKYKKHIDKVTNRANPEKYEFSMAGDANKLMRQDLANAIAISALTGDHDINPGNMIAIKGGRLARIDFGHAFNDLLHHSRTLGGELRNEANQILDFINRTEVSGGSSKLWRDYDIMPSQELANAFKELSSKSSELEKGVNDAKKSFEQLVADLKNGGQANKEVIKHITDSLLHINDSVKGEPIESTKPPEEIIDTVFKNLHKFCKENQEKMRDVGKLMQMQVDIDKLIEDKRTGKPLNQELSLKVKLQYQELHEGVAKGISRGQDGIEWCKLDKKTDPHIGDLDSYIQQRATKLGLNKKFVEQLSTDVKATSAIPAGTPNLRTGEISQDLARKVAAIYPPVASVLSSAQSHPTTPVPKSPTIERRKSTGDINIT